MNRAHPRTDTLAAHAFPSPSPEIKPAEVLNATCDRHHLQFIHIIGNRVCACPNGCIYSYPKLELLMEV